MSGSNEFETWQNITMLIENEDCQRGTGFLIKPSFTGNDNCTYVKWFLVTNKHVLHESLQGREQAAEIILYPRSRDIDGSFSRKQEIVNLLTETGKKVWREHPDPEVDVLLIDVTGLVINNTLIEHQAFGSEAFGHPAVIQEHRIDIGVGTEIAVIGYPNLLTDDGVSRPLISDPIVYRGTLATPFDHPLQEHNRKVRGFLINTTVVPGASGSPVILWPGQQIRSGGRSFLGSVTPPFLLGILAETRFGDVKVSRFGGQAFAGAGMAYSVDTIVETLQLFIRTE